MKVTIVSTLLLVVPVVGIVPVGMVRHGDKTIHLVGPASIRDLDLGQQGVVLDPPRGPVVGSGGFAKLVRPYVSRAP